MANRPASDSAEHQRFVTLSNKLDELHTAVDAIGASLDKMRATQEALAPVIDAIRRIEDFLGEPR